MTSKCPTATSPSVQVVINEEKIAGDAKWDGLKGYVTNTDLKADDVVDGHSHSDFIFVICHFVNDMSKNMG